MGQQKGSLGSQLKAKGVTSGSGTGMSALAGHPMSMLFGGGFGRGAAKASISPSASSSASGTSSPFSKQENFGINSSTSPFGGLRGGSSDTRRTTDFDADINLPGTSVGLTPGSEDKEEEDTITAPTINDEEKRREAADKASSWLD